MNIVMIADNDPAGMGIAFTHAINRYTSHRCRLITSQERYGHDYETDLHLPELDDDFGEVEQVLRDADIFHFHMLRNEHSHLGPLVIRDYIHGKAVLHHHHGHPDYVINASAFNERYRHLKRKVIVATPDLLHVAESATWVPNLVPTTDPLFLPRYDSTLPPEPVRVCQCPTRTYHKNTREFLRVMERLRKNGAEAVPVVVRNTPYRQCLRTKRSCHIVFDHMQGWFGISSLESLSQGKPVIAGLDAWNREQIRKFTGREELPWVTARNEEELETVLTALIRDPAQREEIGRRSREFMETCWNEKRVLEVLMDVYRNL